MATMTVDTSAMRQDIERAAEREQAPTVLQLIERQTPAIARLFRGDDAMAERFTRVALTEVKRTPKLLECDPHSFLGALMLSAQLGLEPGPLGHVYLVPFDKTVTWILGYTGMVELARRAGVVGLRAVVVHERDEYVQPWENERGQHWTWRPAERTERVLKGDDPDRGDRVAVLVTWKDGRERLALHVGPERIARAVKASKAASKGVGPWATDTDAMWRKTGIRAARPFLPMTPEWTEAVVRDEIPAPTDTDVLDGDTLALDLAASVSQEASE